jgi:hypothetical protein
MPRRGGVGRWETAAIWVAIAAVGAFLLILALRFGDVVNGIYRDSDYSSTPVIAQLLGDKGSGDVTLGNYPWIESLYALRLTRWLPDHRGVWDALPFVGYVCTVLIFAWTLRRAVSSRAALVGALAVACPAPLVLGLLGAPANRLPTLAHAILLAAFLITVPALVSRPSWARGLWAAALAVSLAPGVASDPLLVLWGVVPLIAAVAVGWRVALVTGRDAALAAAATVAGALGGRLIAGIAADDGIHKASFPVKLVAPKDWPSNAWDVLRSISQFLHGEFVLGSLSDPLAAAVSTMAAVATAGAPLLFIVTLFRLPGVLADDDRPAAQRLLLVFWITSIAGVVGALLLTDVAVGVSTVRYLLVAWPGLLALAMIVWRQKTFVIVATLATACAVIGIVQLERGLYDNQGIGPGDREIVGIERFVAENKLDHGYAGYWDAAPITYLSNYRALTYPVAVCGATGRGFCQFSLHTMDSWYVPDPEARTFLVYDTRDIPVNLIPPPERWGRPFAQARVGNLRLYAYGYDIASVLAEGSRPNPAAVRRNELAAG